MPILDDMELIREYAEKGSELAFETLLKRHISLVYSAALRQVHDPALAAEITQTTFIILARKARSLGGDVILSGWLYRTAQFAAARALRTENRRRDREREAAQMQTEQTDRSWELLAQILDQAMVQLNPADRNAIVLRYFENRSAKDVAAVFGINESAAQKRLGRAIEKLRSLCTKRGVAVSAIVLTTLISSNAVQAAPAGIVTATSAALKGAALGTSTSTLVKGTLDMLAWAKMKFALLAGLGLLCVAGTGAYVVVPRWHQPKYLDRPIGAWLAQLDDGQRETTLQLRWEHWDAPAHYTAPQAQAAEAVRFMGTASFPYILDSLARETSWLDRLSGQGTTPALAAHRRAALALDALGPQAKPLIPQLTRFLRGDTSPKEAAIGLAAIGPEGWQVLTTSLNDKDSHVAWQCSIWALGSHRAAVPGTVPALEAGFADEESGNLPMCGWALAEIGQDRDHVVDLLISSLDLRRMDTKWGCAVALGHMGPYAKKAVPALLALVNHPDYTVRHDVAQALERIDPQTAAKAGVTGALAKEHVPRTMPVY